MLTLLRAVARLRHGLNRLSAVGGIQALYAVDIKNLVMLDKSQSPFGCWGDSGNAADKLDRLNADIVSIAFRLLGGFRPAM